MRLMPKAEREAMFAIYCSAALVDDIADDGTRPRAAARRGARRTGASDLDALYAGRPAGQARFLQRAGASASACSTTISSRVIDGMEMDVAADIRAPDLATLDLYCDRVASAVGRLSIKRLRHGGGAGRSSWRIISAARCSSPISCATSTRMPRRPPLPAARTADAGRHRQHRSGSPSSPIRASIAPAGRSPRRRSSISPRRIG